jgi:hypothetical protein
MMPLEPFELRDHHRAGRDQRVTVVRVGIRQEGLDKAPIGSNLVGPVIRGGNNQQSGRESLFGHVRGVQSEPHSGERFLAGSRLSPPAEWDRPPRQHRRPKGKARQ